MQHRVCHLHSDIGMLLGAVYVGSYIGLHTKQELLALLTQLKQPDGSENTDNDSQSLHAPGIVRQVGPSAAGRQLRQVLGSVHVDEVSSHKGEGDGQEGIRTG